MRRHLHMLLALSIGATAVGMSWALGAGASELASPAMTGAVPSARCGPDDLPERGIQGRVSLEDRQSGRSQLGYTCNVQLVGRFQGEGSSWVSQSYKDCAYMSTRFGGSLEHPGVQVIDVADPGAPKRVGALTSPAMLGTWESLKVNSTRGLLAAVGAGGGLSAATFSVYEVETDCRRPQLLNSMVLPGLTLPSNTLGHEGDWSPDGRTYWATSLFAGTITAIDVTDPASPRVIYVGQTSPNNHGLSLSHDGNFLYVAKFGAAGAGALKGNGLQIFDVSEIQDRQLVGQMRLIGEELWQDGSAGQHALSVTYGDNPYVVFVDEADAGAARVIDVSNPSDPVVVSKLKLEIHLPEHADLRSRDTAGTGPFGYEGHYCAVDRPRDPRALACGFIQSGVRVFDLRDPLRPREIAYFNPPAQTGKNGQLGSSEHALAGNTINTDPCTSPPRFVGRRQLWVTCQDNGFLALRFTHGVGPFD